MAKYNSVLIYSLIILVVCIQSGMGKPPSWTSSNDRPVGAFFQQLVANGTIRGKNCDKDMFATINGELIRTRKNIIDLFERLPIIPPMVVESSDILRFEDDAGDVTRMMLATAKVNMEFSGTTVTFSVNAIFYWKQKITMVVIRAPLPEECTELQCAQEIQDLIDNSP